MVKIRRLSLQNPLGQRELGCLTLFFVFSQAHECGDPVQLRATVSRAQGRDRLSGRRLSTSGQDKLVERQQTSRRLL